MASLVLIYSFFYNATGKMSFAEYTVTNVFECGIVNDSFIHLQTVTMAQEPPLNT